MEKEQSTQGQADLDALKAFLVEHVRKHYEQGKDDLLLANVGWALNTERPDLRQQLGRRTVGQFIRREMTDLLEVPPNPSYPTAPYVFLRGQQPKPSEASTTPDAGTVEVGAVKPRKYAHAVVLSFTRPISPNCKRFLVLADPVHYRDIAIAAPAPADGFLIDPGLIETVGAVQTKADFQQALDKRIDQWLQLQNLALERILEQPKAGAAAAKSTSLWDHLLASLTEAERKRIQLPLDIVAKLQNTPK